MLVLVIVAILIVAVLASVAYILLSQGNPPSSPPPVKLDHVTVSGGVSVDQSGYLPLSAVAVDTKGTDRTAAATWSWSANPAASVIIFSATSSTIEIRAKATGSVTITANATWNNSAKESTHTVTISALTYVLTPAQRFPLVGEFFDVTVSVLRGSVPAATYNGTINFTSDDTGATLPADHTFTAVDAGQRTFVAGVKVSRAGAVAITGTDTFATITGSTSVNGNRAPTARVTITPDAANPLHMTASGTGSTDPDGDALTYAWDLGDGTPTATSASVAHTYALAGAYVVVLTVTDTHAVSNSNSTTYHAKAPPIARFAVEGQSVAGTGVRVAVNASLSSDPDGTIMTYNWTWGDGNYSEVSVPLTSHDYGAFWITKDVTIILRAIDNDNLANSTSQRITVSIVPRPPVANFSFTQTNNLTRSVSVDARNSTDPNGNIFSYNWSWGDGRWINISAPTTTASHVYLTDGDFTVNLTVVDTTNLRGYFERMVSILQPSVPPVAVLNVTRNLMAVDADASGSSDLNGDIVSYTFNWGDGNTLGPQASPLASHTYSTANAYTIILTVTDSTSRQGTARVTVSVATSTLDYSFHDFFNVPYGEWWDHRYVKYGDLPIGAECFNQTSIADGVCTPSKPNVPDVGTYPYTNWYPLPGQVRPGNPTNNPLVYAPYRFDVKGVNVPGYNRSQPVFLPVLNYGAAPGNQLDFRWYMQYLDDATGTALTNLGCPSVDPKFNDGFEIRSQIWLTLDLQESKRIFGVPVSDNANQAQTWWNSNTNNACGTQGALENTISSWFETLGGPSGAEGKYDVVNSFEYQYTPFYTNITAKVDPSTGLTQVYVEHGAWATEVLLARMFYWGNASYLANYLDSTKARGWWGMELAWFEDFNFQGSLGPPNGGFDFTLSSVMQYHYQLLTDPKNGVYDQIDDVPYWTWGPILSDYTNDYSPKHLVSELDRYPSPYYGYVHSTPGSIRYGVNQSYDYVPIRWDLAEGQTWHFQYPTGNVVFYDPNNTPLGADPRYGAYVPIRKTLAYASQKPANFGAWDAKNMTWDVYGPAPTGGPVGNAGADLTPGNGDDRYALVPWGALNLVPGVVALFAQSSPASLSPASDGPFIGTGFAISSSPSNPSWTAVAPIRWSARSRTQ